MDQQAMNGIQLCPANEQIITRLHIRSMAVSQQPAEYSTTQYLTPKSVIA
jgi:hypothetical protein